MALAFWTNAQVIGQLDSGWHIPGSSWSYGFPTNNSWIPAGTSEKAGFAAFNPVQQAAASLAVQAWDDLMAPTIAAAGATANATIRFSNHTATNAYSYAYYPHARGWEGSSVWINPHYAELTRPVVGDYSFMTYLHELGHTFGLNHMGNYNGTANWATDASSLQDSHMYSVMSYFAVWETGQANWTVNGADYYAQTPMLNDVLAIQSMYGADLTTRTGATVYGFNSSGIGAGVASIYNFNLNLHPILTVYDAGGVDTLDLSGYVKASNIDIAAGHYSSAAGMTNNIAIAYNTVIENAVGGWGNDTVAGNDAANQLSGGAGADLIFGGNGNDTIDGGSGSDTLTGGAGNDTYLVDRATDVVVEAAGAGIDTVIAGFSYTLGANLENLTLTGTSTRTGLGNSLDNSLINAGSGSSVLYGLDGNDSLVGGAADDTLSGGNGNDGLSGGLGNNLLSGGAGVDTFLYSRQLIGSVSDTITDFTASGLGHDILKISRDLAVGFSDLVAHHAIAQSGVNTIVTLASNEVITLLNVSSVQVTADDFLFA